MLAQGKHVFNSTIGRQKDTKTKKKTRGDIHFQLSGLREREREKERERKRGGLYIYTYISCINIYKHIQTMCIYTNDLYTYISCINININLLSYVCLYIYIHIVYKCIQTYIFFALTS